MSPAATTSCNNNEMSNNRDENQRQQQQQQQRFQQQQAMAPNASFYSDEHQFQHRGGQNNMMNYPSPSVPSFLNQSEHPNAGYSSQMDHYYPNTNNFNYYNPQQMQHLQQQQFQLQQQQQQLHYKQFQPQQQQPQPQFYQPSLPLQPPAQLQQFNAEGETDELDEFILDLLTKPQQRLFLLKTELEFEAFIKNERQLRLDFPPMNSYQRLMIHKLAPYYKLNHYHDPLRKGVYVCKTFTTEMPKIRLPEVNVEGGTEPKKEVQETTPPQFKIMRRSTGSSPNSRPSNQDQKVDRKNLTFEERKTAYEEARARIFQDMEQKKTGDNDSQQE